MKKLIAILLVALMLISAMPMSAFAAETSESEAVGASSGTTGNCTWTLDDEGTLTISGNGMMGDYSSDSSYYTAAPWGTNIKSVVIDNGAY